jgi:Fic family protein
MRWNWEQPDWPDFAWDATRLARAEQAFLLAAGVVFGVVEHLGETDADTVRVETFTSEALTTSEIEGEFLDRDSVQSSIRRQLGLSADPSRSEPAEEGIAELMVACHRTAADPLTHDTLFGWHRLLMKGRRDLDDVGRYRTQPEPMQVVSGRLHDPTVHFEAPPSDRVPGEMDRFVDWFNRTAPGGTSPLLALTRSGLVHQHFVCIHPFEDGNGRIARALCEKAISQTLGRSTLLALAATILARRREYYDILEASNKRNEVSGWLAWFAGVALEAQQRTHALVEFTLDKTRLLDRLRDQLNHRQEKAVLRMLREGPRGFEGGLTASKYIGITGATTATASRDLADLVAKGVFTRGGERKHTRYHLAIPLRPTPRITVSESGEIDAASSPPS